MKTSSPPGILSAGVLSPMTGVMQQSSAVSPRDGETHVTYYCGNVIYDGNVTRILTDEGYVTFNGITPVYHYYLKDHLGNNRVVLGQNGAVEQVNHYYPFGGLMGESIGGSTQPYKYNGKELDRANGLDWCDYGARWYDATRIGWTSVDPLCEKYYDISPYVYCHDNPIRLVDLDGERPTLAEATLLAKHVYGGEDARTTSRKLAKSDWHVSKRFSDLPLGSDSKSGLKSQFYERTKDGKTEFCYAFAGTDDAQDIQDDICQYFGILPKQYQTAIANAEVIATTLGDMFGENVDFTFVGHSLGGGEAAAASMATGKDAITFNPAAVSLDGNASHITNNIALGEKIFSIFGYSLYFGGDCVHNIQCNTLKKTPGSIKYMQFGTGVTHTINYFYNYFYKK